jgi:RHS repeat-associated protein
MTQSTICASHPPFAPPRFTGKERDTESGNDYFGARYYSSAMGRWLSPDWSAKIMPVPYAMLENPQSLNLYAYLMNNPLSRFDPDGHACNSLSSPGCSAAEHQALENRAANSPYRLVVASDSMENGARVVTYEVRKFDSNGNLVKLGKDDPQFHVTEHQTSDKFGGTHGFGAGDYRSNDSVDKFGNSTPASSYTPNKFEDSLSPGIQGSDSNPTRSLQSFTISTSPGLDPKDSQPILVNLPGTRDWYNQTNDHGVMAIQMNSSAALVNGTSGTPTDHLQETH